MLELNDLVLMMALNLVFIVIVSVIIALSLRWIMDWTLMKRLESCENTVKNAKSRGVQNETQARLNEAMLRAAELYKGAGENPDMVKLAGQLAVEYPDIALRIPGELGKWSKKLGM